MSKLTAYKCFECGHYTVSTREGLKCQRCKGGLNPMGHATYVAGVNNALKVEVSVKDTKLFEKMVGVLKALVDDKHTPNWIKKKIQEHILEEI